MKWVVIVLASFSVSALASDGALKYFDQELALNKIYWSQSKNIDEQYSVVVAYAINTELSWEYHKVGIFLVNPQEFVTLDIFPSERSYDFIPYIEAISDTELVVSVNSDYGELKKIKYLLNLSSETILVQRIELEPKGIPKDLH